MPTLETLELNALLSHQNALKVKLVYGNLKSLKNTPEKFSPSRKDGKNEESWGDRGLERRPRSPSIAWRQWVLDVIVVVAIAAVVAAFVDSTTVQKPLFISAKFYPSPTFTFMFQYRENITNDDHVTLNTFIICCYCLVLKLSKSVHPSTHVGLRILTIN